MRKISLALVFVIVMSVLLSGCADNVTQGQSNILLEEPKKDYIILSDLDGAEIGIIEGVTDEAQVKEKIKDAKLTSFATVEEGAKALLDNKITALIVDTRNAEKQFKDDKRVVVMLQKFIDANYAAATFVQDPAKDSDSFKMVIDATINRIKLSGELDAMGEKYFSGTAPETADFEYNNGVVAGRVLKVGVAKDNDPFAYKDSNGKYIGLDVELANQVAKEWGATLEVVEYSKDKLLDATKNGEVKMVLGGLTEADDADKKDWMLFSDSYYDNSQLVFLNAANVAMSVATPTK